MLEAYPGLPILLYAIERAMQRRIRAVRGESRSPSSPSPAPASPWQDTLNFQPMPLEPRCCTACGEATGGLRMQIVGALVLGAGASAVIWWPMVELIRRSTRVLALNGASNDIVLPYHRLLAALFSAGYRRLAPWCASRRDTSLHPLSASRLLLGHCGRIRRPSPVGRSGFSCDAVRCAEAPSSAAMDRPDGPRCANLAPWPLYRCWRAAALMRFQEPSCAARRAFSTSSPFHSPWRSEPAWTPSCDGRMGGKRQSLMRPYRNLPHASRQRPGKVRAPVLWSRWTVTS